MFRAVFLGIPSEQASVNPIESTLTLGARNRRSWAAAGIALAGSLLAASAAQAQNCTLTPNANITNLGGVGSSPAAVGSMVGASITASSTAFLLQSSSFVGAPGNPAPDQQGGGIWVRGVGGEVTVKTTTATTVTGISTTIPGGSTSSPVNCAEKVRTDFAGIQFGADISKLNLNG
jgi:hypothetical protein